MSLTRLAYFIIFKHSILSWYVEELIQKGPKAMTQFSDR